MGAGGRGHVYRKSEEFVGVTPNSDRVAGMKKLSKSWILWEGGGGGVNVSDNVAVSRSAP